MSEIIIDIQKIKNLHSGLGQFMLHLTKSLISLNSDNKFYFFINTNDKQIFEKNTNISFILNKWYKSLNFIKSKKIIHATHQESNLIPLLGNPRIILTIHDLNFLYKNYSPIKKKIKLWKIQRKINKAKIITFISNFTRSEVDKYLNLKEKETVVIYNGVEPLIQKSTQPNFMKDVGEYIFSLALISDKKNFHVILPILKQHTNLYWVLAGNKSAPYAQYILELAKNEGLENRLIMPGVINDNDKSWLYQHCKAFCFPSLAEGFGLPVIEAMQIGKPVFISDKTSLPEIGGQEAYYWNTFEPQNINAIFDAGMLDYENNPNKAAKIKLWAAQFTWENAALAYNRIYEHLSDN